MNSSHERPVVRGLWRAVKVLVAVPAGLLLLAAANLSILLAVRDGFAANWVIQRLDNDAFRIACALYTTAAIGLVGAAFIGWYVELLRLCELAGCERDLPDLLLPNDRTSSSRTRRWRHFAALGSIVVLVVAVALTECLDITAHGGVLFRGACALVAILSLVGLVTCVVKGKPTVVIELLGKPWCILLGLSFFACGFTGALLTGVGSFPAVHEVTVWAALLVAEVCFTRFILSFIVRFTRAVEMAIVQTADLARRGAVEASVPE